MQQKTIKVSKENYVWLLKISAELQKQYGKPISFDYALNVLRAKKMERKKLSEFAGRWKMSGKEAKSFIKDTRRGWKKWEIPSV